MGFRDQRQGKLDTIRLTGPQLNRAEYTRQRNVDIARGQDPYPSPKAAAGAERATLSSSGRMSAV
jgi:hypothetical protein